MILRFFLFINIYIDISKESIHPSVKLRKETQKEAKKKKKRLRGLLTSEDCL